MVPIKQTARQTTFLEGIRTSEEKTMQLKSRIYSYKPQGSSTIEIVRRDFLVGF